MTCDATGAGVRPAFATTHRSRSTAANARTCRRRRTIITDGDHFARSLQTHDVSRQLRVPERELEAERHRLGVHTVGTSDHRRASVFHRTGMNGADKRVEIAEQQIARFAHLNGLRGVDDIGRRHAEVQPARRRGRSASATAVVNAMTSCWVTSSICSMRAISKAPRSRISRAASGGADARPRHGLGCGRFDLQPGLDLPLVAPDATHFRMRITPDHLSEITPA